MGKDDFSIDDEEWRLFPSLRAAVELAVVFIHNRDFLKNDHLSPEKWYFRREHVLQVWLDELRGSGLEEPFLLLQFFEHFHQCDIGLYQFKIRFDELFDAGRQRPVDIKGLIVLGSGWVSRWISGWISRWISRWVSRWISRWVSGWISRWVSRWIHLLNIPGRVAVIFHFRRPGFR
jgi:hypothetical protein